MEITVTMSSKEFEEFLAYQKDKQCWSKEIEAAKKDLRASLQQSKDMYTAVCDHILTSVGSGADPVVQPPLSIVNEQELLEAVRMAEDWFA